MVPRRERPTLFHWIGINSHPCFPCLRSEKPPKPLSGELRGSYCQGADKGWDPEWRHISGTFGKLLEHFRKAFGTLPKSFPETRRHSPVPPLIIRALILNQVQFCGPQGEPKGRVGQDCESWGSAPTRRAAVLGPLLVVGQGASASPGGLLPCAPTQGSCPT